MEDLTLRYFDAEMRYLREAAKEFAQDAPRPGGNARPGQGGHT